MSAITTYFGSPTGKIEYRLSGLNGESDDKVVQNSKIVRIHTAFWSRGFLIEKCYGDINLKLLNADGFEIGHDGWVPQIDEYGQKSNCQLLKARGAKYIEISLGEEGKSGEIKVSNENWTRN